MVDVTPYLGKGLRSAGKDLDLALSRPADTPPGARPPQCRMSIGLHTTEKPTLIRTHLKGGARSPALLLIVTSEVPRTLRGPQVRATHVVETVLPGRKLVGRAQTKDQNTR